LYFGSQAFTVRTMLGVGAVNVMYWGTQLVSYAIYKDVVIQGIDLSVHPVWAAFGISMTMMVLYFSRKYANSAILQAYESADGKRIGVQMHTILGFPGKKIEFPIGSAKLFEPKEHYFDPNHVPTKSEKGIVGKLFSSNQIPIQVNGFPTNLVVDKQGTYYENFRLLDLLTPKEAQDVVQAVEKEERINWKHSNNKKTNRK